MDKKNSIELLKNIDNKTLDEFLKSSNEIMRLCNKLMSNSLAYVMKSSNHEVKS